MTNELLFHAALLAGLGPHARSVADELARAATAESQRTCVDAGGALLLAVAAPGPRALRATQRLPGDAAPGGSRWLQTNQAGARLLVEVFSRPTAAAWARAQEVARQAGCENELRRRHAAIGLRGSIFSVAHAPDAPETGAITWQLDRHTAPADVLRACGMAEAWPAASALLQELTGAPLFPRVGPWSLAWALGETGPRLRLGSSLWARMPEDPRKARAMAAAIGRFGGDGRYAEGLYKLLDSARTGHQRIGRAVEIELRGAEAVGIEFFLHVPEDKCA